MIAVDFGIGALKQQAIDKMLKEMEKDHSPTEDVIHNWLCNQEDQELFTGILKEGKSIKNSLSFCASKARAQQTSGSVAMVDYSTVFGWIREYFLSDGPEPKPTNVKVKSLAADKPKVKPEAPKPAKNDFKKKSKSIGEENQLSLFDYV